MDQGEDDFYSARGLLPLTGRAPEFYAPEDAGWLGVYEDLHVLKPKCLKAVVSLGSLFVSVYPSVQYHCSGLLYAELFGRGAGTTRCVLGHMQRCITVQQRVRLLPAGIHFTSHHIACMHAIATGYVYTHR